MILLLIFSMGIVQKGYAAEEKTENEILEELKGYRDSIVHIESKCWDGKEQIYRSRSFSGFVVSEDSSGVYIATTSRNLTYTQEDKENIEAEYQLENNSNISEQIEVVCNGDLRIEASIVGQSEQRNLAILRLNQNINFEHTLSFVKEESSDKDRIFLLSFPAFEKKAIYNAGNVEITKGNITGKYKKNEIVFLKHDIEAESESTGGVLLNDDGMVAGLLLTAKGEKDGTAISAKEMETFLDTLQIGYTEQKEAPAEKKIEIYQIVLGGVILILLLQVFLQFRKNNASQERKEKKKRKGKDKYSTRTVKEEPAVVPKKQKKKANARVSARLEYPAQKRAITIEKSMFVIGRAKEADFILGDSQGISRKHACIQYDGNYFYLTDLKSTNHTYLNGAELKPGEKHALKNGDEIRIAKEKMIFRKG